MKKYFALIGAALALAACIKETPVEESVASEDLTSIVFDFTINRPGETKAVKPGWENGDRVYIFFEDVTTGYVTMDYDGTKWSTPTLNGSATVAALTESGKKLTAVYLPYNNADTCTYNDPDPSDEYPGIWEFGNSMTNVNSYCLRAEKVAYTVTIASGIATLAATLNMTAPWDFVQVFIPDASASGTITMSCNSLESYCFGCVDVDGTIEDYSSLGSQITGYAATIGGETGYYFSGVLPADWSVITSSFGNEWYMTFEYKGTYYDFYKHVDSYITAGTAIKLDKNHLHQVGPGYYVTIGGCQWSTVNCGADVPWQYFYTGDRSNANIFVPWGTNPPALLSGERIPSRAEAESLYSATNQYWVIVNDGIEGFLCVDKTDDSKFVFFPATGNESPSISNGSTGVYWTTSTIAKGSDPDYWGAAIWIQKAALKKVGQEFNYLEKALVFPVRPVKNI